MVYAKLSSRNVGRQGFTLIELLVVIAIIAILAAIIIPAVMAVQGQANSAKDLEQIRGMGNGMTLYYKKYSFFPSMINMSDPVVAPNIGAVRTGDPGKCSVKLLMGGGFVEDAKTFFSSLDASPTEATLKAMMAELNPKTDPIWYTTYAYDPGHNPNHGAVPFFGNRLGMLDILGTPAAHVLTCEQVAKEIEPIAGSTGVSAYVIQNHEINKTVAVVDEIYDDTDAAALLWRDAFLAEPKATAAP